jgi:hypothetical protein
MTVRKKKANVPEVNYRAILKRAEQLIDALRTRYVCEGWRLDEEAASRTLRYLRRLADGGRDTAKEWQAAMDFLGQHGQSIDWIVRGDPSGMICRAAARSPQAAALSAAA